MKKKWETSAKSVYIWDNEMIETPQILTPHCSVSPDFCYSFDKAVPHHLFVTAFVVQTLCIYIYKNPEYI